jgi:hypothetical protein
MAKGSVMEYTTVTNIHWSDSDQTTIDCTVDFVGLGSVPFTVNQNDTENHSIKLWNEINNGDYGAIGNPPPLGTPSAIQDSA